MPTESDLTLSYDDRADVLYIARHREAAARAIEDGHGIVWRSDETGAIIGATVMDFRDRWADEPASLAAHLARSFPMPVAKARRLVEEALSFREPAH